MRKLASCRCCLTRTAGYALWRQCNSTELEGASHYKSRLTLNVKRNLLLTFCEIDTSRNVVEG